MGIHPQPYDPLTITGASSYSNPDWLTSLAASKLTGPFGAATFNGEVYFPATQAHIGYGGNSNYFGGATYFRPVAGGDYTVYVNGANGDALFEGTITAQSGRPVKTYFGYTTYYGDAGGYIIGNRFRGPSDTDLGFIGVVGTGDNLYTYFIGNYGNEIVTFTNVTKAATFNGAVTVAGIVNFGSTDCRMFRDSGSLYIESDATIFMRDTSTGISNWSLSNDGRTFSKTNVWHSDTDGNPRIAYYGSGGATNFYGSYDFVSSTRGHGLKSDGTIVWGGSQGTNNRGTLSWAALDKAVITVPEKLDISAGGAARYLASSHWFNIGATFNGEVLSYGDTNGTHTLLNRNDHAGSSAYSRLALVAYGNSWGIGMGSAANNGNSLEIREDALGANTLRFKMDVGGNASFTRSLTLGADAQGAEKITFQGVTSVYRSVIENNYDSDRAFAITSGGYDVIKCKTDAYASVTLANPATLSTVINGVAVSIPGKAVVDGTAKLGDYTVATLPSASAYTGYECNTTDSSVTTFGSTVAGGGANNVKVRSNGTNWTVTGI